MRCSAGMVRPPFIVSPAGGRCWDLRGTNLRLRLLHNSSDRHKADISILLRPQRMNGDTFLIKIVLEISRAEGALIHERGLCMCLGTHSPLLFCQKINWYKKVFTWWEVWRQYKSWPDWWWAGEVPADPTDGPPGAPNPRDEMSKDETTPPPLNNGILPVGYVFCMEGLLLSFMKNFIWINCVDNAAIAPSSLF